MFGSLAFIWTLDSDICHSNPGIITPEAYQLNSDHAGGRGF